MTAKEEFQQGKSGSNPSEEPYLIHQLSSVHKGNFKNRGYKIYSNIQHYHYLSADTEQHPRKNPTPSRALWPRLKMSQAHLQVMPPSARGSRIFLRCSSCICTEVVVVLYAGLDLASSVFEISLMHWTLLMYQIWLLWWIRVRLALLRFFLHCHRSVLAAERIVEALSHR